MITLDKEGYRLDIDDLKNVAILSWKPNVTLSIYKKGYHDALEMVAAHNLNRCLIHSCQCENVVSEEEEISMLQSEVCSTSTSKLQVALVMTENNYQQMIHNYCLSLAYQHRLPLHINYFTKVEEAMDWLEHEG